MFKKTLFFTMLITLAHLFAQENKTNIQKENSSMDNINDITVLDMNNKEIKLSDYNGKILMIVNVASECGYTKQYAGLQAIYEIYKPKGFEILAFPCNDFGGQEPGTNSEIQEFCKKNYGVSFPMAAKISVKGDDTAPIYKWLCNKTENGILDAEIKWNFGKFLLDEKGNLLNYFPSKVEPMSEEITGKL